MSILTDKLPEAVLIDGEKYPINTDYRTAIKIIVAFESEELTGFEKNEIMLEMLYGENNIPDNTAQALEMALRFLNGDCEEIENSPDEDDSSGDCRLYSFTQDARYIFSGILQTHGIDITDTDMHWWKFIVLFMDLDKDCFFSQLLSIRSRLKKGTLTKEERAWYNENKKIVDLPEHYSEEEAEMLGRFF